jgi:hypothetical protein
VTQCLLNTVPLRGIVWEPCAGQGAMAKVIAERGYSMSTVGDDTPAITVCQI